MVLNLSQLIKSSGTETHPAAQTQSIGLPAYAQLSWFLQSHQVSFIVTRDSQPLTGIRPSTGIIPSGQFCLDEKTLFRQPGFSHLESFVWKTKLSAIYRDFTSGPTSSRSFTGIVQKLFPALTRSATQLNRRAVIKNPRKAILNSASRPASN
jgi:hypothetical protein